MKKHILHYEKVRSFEHLSRSPGSDVIVLLHGLFGSGSNLTSLARLFLRERDVYIVDLPNHGRSPWIEDARYQTAAACLHHTLGQIAEDAGKTEAGTVAEPGNGEPEKGRTDISVKRGIHLLGHSMGGKAVMTLALLHKELSEQEGEAYALRSIIVGDIAPRRYQPGHGVYFQAMKGMPRTENRKEADEYMAGIVPNPTLRSFLLKNLGRGEDNCFYWKLNLDILIRDYSYILGWDIERERISQVPALFLRGTNSDYITPARDRDCIWGHFPHAQLEEIPQSAHWIHSEQPETVFRLVSDFVNSL